MRRLHRILTAIALAFTLVTGAAGNVHAQEADTEPAAAAADRPTSTVTFYGHVFGHGLDAPMPTNTQFPEGEDNYGLGSFDWCTPAGRTGLGTVPEPGVDCHSDPNNKLALFSTAGFVQVTTGSEFTGGGSYEQLHNERGSAKDIVLDKTQPLTAHITMSVDYHAWSVGGGSPETYCPYPNPRDTACIYPYWGWDPGYVPKMVVDAKLYYAVLGEYGSAASEAPPIREAIESGQAVVVAEGATEPTDVMTGLPGSENYVEFAIDLGTPQVDVIPKEANFFLVYSFYQETPAGAASAHTWRIWAGEFFPPRFTMPVKNAFDVELVVPQFIHGKLAILGLISTPWGSYDVNPEATTITITDADGREVEPTRMEAIADYRVAHGAHYKPVNVTFVWDYQKDNLAPGTYTVTIASANNQGSATAECTGSFTIEAGGKAGPVEIGRCGQQTDAQHKNAVGDESSSASAPNGKRALPEVTVLSEVVEPVPTLSPLALLGLAFLGRWRR